ncbi:hypothetical protein PV325_000251 [Microctonus aethiopoides]|uniref:Uncharacterized protein n=1 Tax=Microctonus aethiopoides TaxID=144406 RepID=A0AA39C7Q0_9HYME|nr:hypothetical protein PV325_000251 [Microctonus aethiopoides]KAK0159461.1 hypothetical protein PV328_010337 [Microctonus aethiopoides]
MSAYPKETKEQPTRSGRPRKRHFHGNQNTENDEDVQSSASAKKLSSATNVIVGRQSKSFAEKMDEQRVTRENRRSSLATKEACQARQQQLTEKNEFYEATKGPLYGAGIAD